MIFFFYFSNSAYGVEFDNNSEEYVPGEVIVVLKQGDETEITLEDAEEVVLSSTDPDLSRMYVVPLKEDMSMEEAIEYYSQDPTVAYVQPNFIYTLIDESTESEAELMNMEYSRLWYMFKIGAYDAWRYLYNDNNQVCVAVLDSGVDMTHPDLAGNVSAAIKFDQESRIFRQQEPGDIVSDHGTHVSGIIAGLANNDMGIDGIGFNRAKILSLNCFWLNDKGKAVTTTAELIPCLNYAKDQSAKVINLSLGYKGVDTSLEQCINNLYASGITVVCAAGNDGNNTVYYPAGLDSTISVSSSTGTDALATHSNYNSKVDFAAPGLSIYSTVKTSGGNYAYKNGTSMATAMVSGTAALLLSKDETLSPDDIKEILMQSSVDLGDAGKDDKFGYGRIDAAAAMELLVLNLGQPIIDGEEIQFTVPDKLVYGLGEELNTSGLSIRSAFKDKTDRIIGYQDHSFSVDSSSFDPWRLGKQTVVINFNKPIDLNPGKITFEVEVIENQIQAFVMRLYTIVFNRNADKDGMLYWYNGLKNKEKDAAQVADFFFFSDEFIAQKTTDEEFLNRLYKAFFDRNPDNSGKNYWISYLTKGASRRWVAMNFINSDEFNAICQNFGIIRGSIEPVEWQDQNENITMFVYRCYKETLERVPEAKGINFWCQKIISGSADADDVAEFFVFSDEVIQKKQTDENYIKMLYKSFMGRNADDNGINYWLSALKAGMSKRQVFDFFATCDEFKEILATFGL